MFGNQTKLTTTITQKRKIAACASGKAFLQKSSTGKDWVGTYLATLSFTPAD